MSNEFWKQAGSSLLGVVGNKKGQSATEGAIVTVLDKVLENSWASLAFNSSMMANNMASTHRNNRGTYALEALYSRIQPALPRGSSVADTLKELNQALMEPNIAGIPISTSHVETDREIEISESMVIVQSKQVKQYWTDNAVPRLKEWTIEGYLTSTSAIDDGCIIKPTLQWQAFYLDVCSKSRRPVTFKTNRGEFVKVQITNLHTEEDATYNNAIKVNISLKEYNPYFIEDNFGDTIIATLRNAFDTTSNVNIAV